MGPSHWIELAGLPRRPPDRIILTFGRVPSVPNEMTILVF